MSVFPKQSTPLFKSLLGLLLIVSLLWGALWLYNTLSEVGLTGFLGIGQSQKAHLSVHLKEQPVYKIKKKQELLGMNVVRIISRQQPEEFLVLDGVSRKLVDKVYGKAVDTFWANQMANQFLRLREHGDAASPVSVDIQGVKTLSAGTIAYQKKQLPYWQVEVQFKLSNESESRYYQAGIVRNARDASLRDAQASDAPANALPGGEVPGLAKATGVNETDTDTLVVGYAQKEAFQKDLLPDLLRQLEFEQI